MAVLVMNDDGSGQRVLSGSRSAPLVFVSSPRWSPDGDEIAFAQATARPSGEVRTGIYVMRADGRGRRLLAHAALQPAWSPDGSRMAFVSTRDRLGQTCFHDCSVSGEIYVVHADGGRPRRLTRSPANDSSPAWSPDGERLVFVSDHSNRERHEYELYTMVVSKPQPKQITDNTVWDLEPAWRPPHD